MLRRIIRDVEIYKPDIVYLRYVLYADPLHKLFRVIPGAVEIYTDDIDEYCCWG
jgi:hypothetical protein